MSCIRENGATAIPLPRDAGAIVGQGAEVWRRALEEEHLHYYDVITTSEFEATDCFSQTYHYKRCCISGKVMNSSG